MQMNTFGKFIIIKVFSVDDKMMQLLAHCMREETVTESVREKRALPVVNRLCLPGPAQSPQLTCLVSACLICIKC